MWLLRIGFFAGLAFFGAVAVFLGSMVMLSSLQAGEIAWTYTVSGRDVSDSVKRAADAGRFWRLFGQMGVLPAVLGGAALWFAIRRLRRG